MKKQYRVLRWRVLRGSQMLVLVEEHRVQAPAFYVGLINGRVAVQGSSQTVSGAALIRAALSGG